MAFGRLERTTGPQPMSDINMTPLIDVMLVLLVIFMVAAPLMSAALHLDLPKADSAEATQGEGAVKITLDAQGRLYWNEQALAAAALKTRLLELGSRQPDAELQLAIDQAVTYGRVAELLDALQAAKLTRLAFVTASPASAPQ